MNNKSIISYRENLANGGKRYVQEIVLRSDINQYKFINVIMRPSDEQLEQVRATHQMDTYADRMEGR